MIEAWPREQQRFNAWFNVLNEAYVKARYSHHYQISEEALTWLIQRSETLHGLVKTVCEERLALLRQSATEAQ